VKGGTRKKQGLKVGSKVQIENDSGEVMASCVLIDTETNPRDLGGVDHCEGEQVSTTTLNTA
jgi:hypothetical protein